MSRKRAITPHTAGEAFTKGLNGIALQDREFLAAIREKREPNASVRQVLSCYRVLHELELALA